MTNNDVLKRLRYCFNLNNKTMQKLFDQGGKAATDEQIVSWTLKDDDENFTNLGDHHCAAFLNGLILHLRGPSDKPMPPPEKNLTNNVILRKLKIATNSRDDDMIETLDSANFRLSKSELSAFFRKPDHRHYRECKDQVLRNYIIGLQKKYRPTTEAK